MQEPKEVFDAGDEAKVQKRKTKVQLQGEREVDELRALLSTASGRAVLWRILAKCEIYKSSFTGNSTTFFKEGRRAIGTELLLDITKADPMAYINMQIEALRKETD